MAYIRLTDDIAVAPQLSIEDLDAIKAAGFKAVINNRPDNEGPDQPPQASIAARAAELGLAYRFVPVVSGHFAPEDVAAFREALDDLDGPVVAFCRSGTRLQRALGPVECRQDAGGMRSSQPQRVRGYDLSALRGRLESDGR